MPFFRVMLSIDYVILSLGSCHPERSRGISDFACWVRKNVSFLTQAQFEISRLCSGWLRQCHSECRRMPKSKNLGLRLLSEINANIIFFLLLGKLLFEIPRLRSGWQSHSEWQCYFILSVAIAKSCAPHKIAYLWGKRINLNYAYLFCILIIKFLTL